jgi:hypothetical protein
MPGELMLLLLEARQGNRPLLQELRRSRRHVRWRPMLAGGSGPSSTGWGSGCTNPIPEFKSSPMRIYVPIYTRGLGWTWYSCNLSWGLYA